MRNIGLTILLLSPSVACFYTAWRHGREQPIDSDDALRELID